MSKPREYLVRTFDIASEGNFDCTGEMTKLSSFSERSTRSMIDAIVSIMPSDLSTMVLSHQSPVGEPPIDEVHFTIKTAITKSELRGYQKPIRSAIKTWAEKSRTKGVRGWRKHAIKTPYFEKDFDDTYALKFSLYLSKAIIYDEKTCTLASSQNFLPDLKLFKKRLEKIIGSSITIEYDHSIIGKNELS